MKIQFNATTLPRPTLSSTTAPRDRATEISFDSAIPGAAISRAHLYAKAEDLHRRVAGDRTNPYRGEVDTLNELFLNNLEKYDQPTLGEIKAAVDSSAAADRRKARNIALAGVGLVLGGVVAGMVIPGLPGIASLAAVGGGFILSDAVANRYTARAQDSETFSQQLGNWGQVLASQAPQQKAS